jgi:hypothetical protein
MMAKATAVRWNIQRKGHAWQKEALERWELTPEKIEMAHGKLFCTDEQRILMLGMLLENVGVDAVVRLGNPKVWRDAVQSL